MHDKGKAILDEGSDFLKRGDVYYADLRPVIGSEQGGIRPVLIIQNDTGNKHRPTVFVAAITSKMNKAKLPTHIEIDSKKYDIVKDRSADPSLIYMSSRLDISDQVLEKLGAK